MSSVQTLSATILNILKEYGEEKLKQALVLPEEGRLVHVYLEGEAVPRESPVKQVQIRIHAFAAVQPAPDLHPAAVVDHVDQAQRRVAPAEEVVRRRVQLP